MTVSIKHHAYQLYFPAASLFAALAVPLSVWGVTSGSGWPPGLIGAGHGHELIFGFALALVAGYTLGQQARSALYATFALWLGARIAWIWAPDTLAAPWLSPAFALVLAWQVVPRFSAAKKWRNKITAPLILTVCLLPLLWVLVRFIWQISPQLASWAALDDRRLMHAGVLCLTLLMMFMGGRIIAPTAATTLQKKGIELTARLQPHMESALIILMAAAIAPILLPGLGSAIAHKLSGICLIAVSGVLCVRLARWRLWQGTDRADLIAFGIGYGWLGLGSVALGIAFITASSAAPALHLITIGGLGTLSIGVMLRQYFQRASKTPPSASWVWVTTVLIAVAAVTRFLSGPAAFAQPILLWTSALCWAVAFLGLALKMLALSRR